VTAGVLEPIGTMPFAGVVPWFASLWRALRTAREDRRATAEQRQVLHLIEYVVSSVGDPLLAAKDVDELDDRIDELIGSQEILGSLAILLARHIALFQTSRPMRAADLSTTIVRERLGSAAANLLSMSLPVLDAWFAAQQQALAIIASPTETGSNSFEFSVTNPEIPAELAQCVFHSLRAGICIVALAYAIVADGEVEAWLADALTARLVESVRQHLRLLASFPEVVVDEALVPRAERFDLVAIEARHRRARAGAQRSLATARARLES
jgi:hypothetical protein